MKIDTTLGFGLAGAGRSAREIEDAGYDGVWATETSHDPFGPLALAPEHTTRIELVDDEVLGGLAVVDEPGQMAQALHRRYGEICDRVVIDGSYAIDPARWTGDGPDNVALENRGLR